MNLAIIPARSGSKRIPNKNIKAFKGKPIIAYTLEAARASGVFDKIIVSTDSEEIAQVGKDYGAEVPFMRPKELADNFTPTAPVILNALNWLSKNVALPKYVCCIYSTAPFVQPAYIKQGLELIMSKKVSSVFSVTTFDFPIFRALRINRKGHLKMFWPEHELTRSNDLPEAYHDAGQFYWLDCQTFLNRKKFYTDDALPIIIPRYLVQDVDTPEDWKNAELMYDACKKRGLL